MKRGDWMILLCALLLAAAPLLLLLPRQEAPARAVVRRQGTVVRSLPLDEDAQYIVDGSSGSNTLAVRGGAVSMVQADCPDLTCVKAGSISRTGEVLVCLPHHLTVTIEGEASGIDAVSQ